MTALYLLDTNILSDLIKNPSGPAANRLRAVGEAAICTSIIVAAELRYGCSAGLQVENWLQPLAD